MMLSVIFLLYWWYYPLLLVWSGTWSDTELASELESDLGDTVDGLCTGAGSGLLISVLEKFNWFCLTSLITLGLLIEI